MLRSRQPPAHPADRRWRRKATEFASESAAAWQEVIGFIEAHAQR